MRMRDTITVTIGKREITSSVCKHRIAAIECTDCDIFGKGSTINDLTTWRDRLRDPLGWLRLRLWMIFH